MDRQRNLDMIDILGFDWDEGNYLKNKIRHNVDAVESEQVFHNKPIYLSDTKHSQLEDRYFAYGITDKGRKLMVIFPIRKNKIRIISARDQSKTERRFYEKAKTYTKI